MKRLIFLVIITGLLSFNSLYAKSLPPGIEGFAPSNIMIMLDTSGSMGWASGGNMYPVELAIDSSGNLYVLETFNHRVAKYDSSGKLLKRWGRYGSGNGQFKYPYGIAVDSAGNVYVSDYYNHRIQKFTSSGGFITKWGSYGTGNTNLRYPIEMEVDSNNNLYVTEWIDHRVKKFTSSGSYITKWGSYGTGDGQLRWTWGVGVDSSDNIYIVEYGNHRVQKFTSSGNFVTKWGSLGSGNTNFYYPRYIDIDSSDNLYIGELKHRVKKFTSSGSYITKWGSYGTKDGEFRYPMGIAVDGNDNIYVADYYNRRVQKFNSAREHQINIGKPKTPLEEAKEAIKFILSQSELTLNAYFGLMQWASTAKIRVKISEFGAEQIKSDIGNLTASGGTHLHSAMNLAKQYFGGGDSPIIPGSDCQKTFLIVISDGCWWGGDPDGTAKALYNSKGIKTHVIGFHTSGSTCTSNYTSLAKAGETYPVSPLYAEDQDDLKRALESSIRTVIKGSFTFTSPVIMPSVESEGKDHILQPTFEFSSDHQWKGRLKKFELDDDGTVGDKVWDAGDKLDAKKPEERQIWTVGTDLSHSLNNFHDDNSDSLKYLLFEGAINQDDDDVDELINFVRGEDAFDEDEDDDTDDERWKLADIYHSRPVIVGPPSASVSSSGADINTEAYYRGQNKYADWFEKKCGVKSGASYKCSQRDEVVFVGSNGGMLHAFDSKTGDELWAFIPPSVLGKLRAVKSNVANKSNSIYGVDGSPVVKDIYYDNSWKTVLLSGLGRGGNSYFALDITDVHNPAHLFTFLHDPLKKVVQYWGSARSDDEVFTYGDYDSNQYPPPGNFADYNYGSDTDFSPNKEEGIGEGWSSPLIHNVKAGNTRKWVAVFGGGYSGHTAYGSSLYVIDLESGGKLLRRVDIEDSSASNIVNAVPAALTSVTADTTTKADSGGAMVYFTDIEGKLWKLDLTDRGTLLDDTSADNRVIASGDAGSNFTRIFDDEATTDNDRYTYHQVTPSIGTDARLWTYFGTGNQLDLDRRSANIKNRIFGVKDSNYPLYQSIDNTSILKASEYDLAEITAGASCTGKEGWYLDLGTDEKVTGKAAVLNGAVFFSRYTPNSDICLPGNARITEHNDYMCGFTDKAIELGTGIPTAPVIYKKKIYIGVSTPAKIETLPTGWTYNEETAENIIVGTPSKPSAPGAIETKSYREVYR